MGAPSASRWLALLLLGLLLAGFSSFLGLARPMYDDDLPLDEDAKGWTLFGDVWQANFWGDAAFVLGTSLTLAACATLYNAWQARVPGLTPVALFATALLAMALTWAVYAVSWSLTGHAYLNENGFWHWKWDMAYGEPLLGRDNAWEFTWVWGWIGIAGTAILAPLAAWATMRAGAPAPAGAAAPAPPALGARPPGAPQGFVARAPLRSPPSLAGSASVRPLAPAKAPAPAPLAPAPPAPPTRPAQPPGKLPPRRT